MGRDFILAKLFDFTLWTHWASLVAQLVKNPPAMRETWVGKIPGKILEKRKATHSSIQAWRIPWTTVHRLYGPWVRRVRH